MVTPYEFKPLHEGDRFSASQWTDLLLPLMHREDVPQEGIVESTGTIHSYAIVEETFRWGKLDSALTPGNKVTVSLWNDPDDGWAGWSQDSNEDWEDCYAPPLMSSGSVASGKWVLVRDFGPRKVIIAHEC